MSMNNPKNSVVLTIIFLLLQLTFLFIIKYENQDLPITNFSFFKTGNLLNTFLYAGIIIVLSVAIKKNLVSKKIISVFLIISWILLLLAFISTKIKFFSQNDYFLYQPLNKIVIGMLFLIYLLTLLYFFLYLLNKISTKEKVKYFKVVLRTFILLLIFFVMIIIYIDNSGYSSDKWAIKKNKKNIAIVLGAAVWTGNIPSPTLSSRVDKAMQLYNEGFVGKIVLTGGKAP